jgi:two-component system response regulator PilR (NtrC family)
MSARTPHRILLVDDQPSILFAMSEYLAARDYVVDCAHDRAEAVALLEQHAYGVVIADLRLTPARVDDGLDVLSAARECSRPPRTILLTAYGSPAVEREARRRGADVVLQKPQPLSAIAGLVEQLLEGPTRAS